MRLRSRLAGTRRVLALVLVNVVIFLALVITTNIASGLLLKLSENATVRDRVHAILGVGRTPLTSNAELPPYAGNEERARELWEELERAKSFEYVPFVEWKKRPFRGKYVTISETGDRIYDRGTDPPPGAPVVRFFGGSAMWGTGVDDSHTIPAVYARGHPRYRVYNHGEGAYNSRQNLERLINLMTLGQRTDVAVFYEGFNDAIVLCEVHTALNGQDEEATMRSILSDPHPLSDVFYGQTLQLLQKLRGKKGEEFRCDSDPGYANRVAATVANVWKLARRLQEAGCGRLIVVLQPVASLGHPRVDYLGDENDADPLEDYDRYERQLRAVYPKWQAAARRAENRSWLFDLTNAFDGNRPIFIDLVHVANAGNETMAARMAPLVDRALADVKRCRTGSRGGSARDVRPPSLR